MVITGASSGIGLEAAVKTASLGGEVILVARDRQRGDRALADVRRRSASDAVSLFICDFSSLIATRTLAAELRANRPRIDILVNNAGTVSPDRRTTEDGFEQTFAVNHLAPFLLTNLLLDSLERSAAARVINVSSAAHRSGEIDFENLHYQRGGYSLLKAYGRSKLANVLFTRELARRLAGTSVTSNCLHPGVVATNIWSHAHWYAQPLLRAAKLFMLSPAHGGDTIVHLATSPEVEGQSGGYYEKNRRVAPSALADDLRLAQRLWDESARLTGIPPV